jgi:hypothetical protein
LEKIYFQVDVLASFWKSINNTCSIRNCYPEYRYHFNEKYDGFYAVEDVGGSIYKVSN